MSLDFLVDIIKCIMSNFMRFSLLVSFPNTDLLKVERISKCLVRAVVSLCLVWSRHPPVSVNYLFVLIDLGPSSHNVRLYIGNFDDNWFNFPIFPGGSVRINNFPSSPGRRLCLILGHFAQVSMHLLCPP